jgi:hypothetical protein
MTVDNVPDELHRQLQGAGRRIAAVLRDRPDLLKPVYRKRVAAGAHPLTGHCYIAAEALWWAHKAAARKLGYRPYVMRVAEGTHWFLKHPSGRTLDPTRAQFEEPPDYRAARGCGFLTKEPSRRCRAVLAALARRGSSSSLG